MTPIKRAILTEIRERAKREAARLAGELAHADGEEREIILANLVMKRWLAANCQACLDL